jgi:hypothetical protein
MTIRLAGATLALLLLAGCETMGGYFNPGNDTCLKWGETPVTYYTCNQRRASDGICLSQTPQYRMEKVCVHWQCKPGYENAKSGNCVKKST